MDEEINTEWKKQNQISKLNVSDMLRVQLK